MEFKKRPRAFFGNRVRLQIFQVDLTTIDYFWVNFSATTTSTTLRVIIGLYINFKI